MKWKSWQILVLAYLFLLNFIVLGALAYVVLTYDFTGLPPQPKPAPVVLVTLAPLPTPTFTPLPPVATSTPSPTPTPIPPLNIPPAPLPTQTRPPITETAVAQVAVTTATPTSTSTATPPPTVTFTPIPSATPTATPRPTFTPTNTPSPTSTSTLRPSPTPPPTATPQPSPTPTQTPRPTATATSQPTPTPTFTSTPRPIPTSLPSPTATTAVARIEATPVAVANAANTKGVVQPEQMPAGALLPVKAIALTNGSIALSWEPVTAGRQYRLYSDMGSGYGVYIYKAQTAAQPAFLDEMLRPGMTYHYRITHLPTKQEIILAQAAVTTTDDKIAKDTLASQINPSPASVTAQPTTLPPDAVLLGLVSDSNFTDNFNTLTIAGEVRNDSLQNVGQTSITITFYDAAGAVIDVTNGETLLKIIPPGETSPFLITLTRPPGLASYSLRAWARPVTPKPKAQLAVVEVKRFEDEAGFFHIKGIIQNTGQTPAKRTKVVAVIYSRDGRVINVNFAYVNPPNLVPGAQANYDVLFTYYPKYFSQTVLPFEE